MTVAVFAATVLGTPLAAQVGSPQVGAAQVGPGQAGAGSAPGAGSPTLPRAGSSAAHGTLLLDVGFVAQGELLCGGAAVEMALRHRGASGIYAHDFRGLVREAEGGIRTDDLAGAVRALGWPSDAGTTDETALMAALAEDRPPVVLLAVGEGRHHYVLVVGRTAGAFVVHDPAERPGVLVPETEFRERWAASGRWALIVRDRVAERPGAGPRTSEGPLSTLPGSALAGASAHFREGRWAEARALAERATEEQPSDSSAWRLLATTRYLDGDPAGALRAWSAVGAPVTETVAVTGLLRTRHPVVHRLLGLVAGEQLRADALERARRRLSLLPAAEAAFVSYRTAGRERAEVRAAVVERPLLPRGRRLLLTSVLSAAAESEITAGLASPTGGGEALEVTARWARARPSLAATLAAPGFLGVPGVGVLSVARDGERHRAPGTAAVSREERVRVRVGFADWASSRVFWRAGAGIDRWAGTERTAVLDLGSVLELGALRLRAGAEAALGPGDAPRYLRWDLEAGSEVALGGPWAARWRGLAQGVGRGAPLAARPGVGAGSGRDGLLRAHPLESGGALDASLLGTSVLNASAEIARQVFAAPPLATLEVAVFMDAARLRAPGTEPTGDVDALVDVGAGLRARLPGGTLRLDGALGRGGARALSLVWTPTALPLR